MGMIVDLLDFVYNAVFPVLFWLGIIGVVIAGLTAAATAGVIQGLAILIFGPIAVRVYCELLIVIFQIHEALEGIRQNQQQGRSL